MTFAALPVAACAALLLAASAAATASPPRARIIVQQAPLAGFVYYEGRDVWAHLKPGERLDLVREPANPHDANAIRLEWQGRMLGYVPRRDNTDLARQMDLGARPLARVTALARAANGRHRVGYEISVPLE